MTKQAVLTDRAPEPIGPYSQAVRVGNLLFLSGQIPLDPASGKMVEGDVAKQTQRVLDNLMAVLAEAGATADQVVKTTIYLADMGDFGAVNEVYARYFAGVAPARAAVQAARLPKDARVEIEAVAVFAEGS